MTEILIKKVNFSTKKQRKANMKLEENVMRGRKTALYVRGLEQKHPSWHSERTLQIPSLYSVSLQIGIQFIFSMAQFELRVLHLLGRCSII
jgi:hypothetical protein